MKTWEQCCDHFGVNVDRGLSPDQVKRNLDKYGPNGKDIFIRGHPHITSPPWGGGGVCKMMTYDDRGEGAYELMTSSIKEAFWSSIQKRSLNKE